MRYFDHIRNIFLQNSLLLWGDNYILLHGLFCIDPSILPASPYFTRGPLGPRENMGWQGEYEGQCKTIHVITYLFHDFADFWLKKNMCFEYF